MKHSSSTRKIDKLGRIVVLSDLRRNLGIVDGDALEIFAEGDKIILKKYEPVCVFTNSSEDLVEYKGKTVSKKAIKELAQLAGIRR